METKNLKVQCLPELLFHLENLSLSLPDKPGDKPGNFTMHELGGGEKPRLGYSVSMDFQGISVGVVNMQISEEGWAKVFDAITKNVNTLYRHNLERKRLKEEKVKVLKEQSTQNNVTLREAHDHAGSALRKHGYNRVSNAESQSIYDTHFEALRDDLGIKDLDKTADEYDRRIQEATEKTQPGLYADGVNGDFRKYFKKVVEIRKENARAKGYLDDASYSM